MSHRRITTTGTGFLQNDACWRSLGKLPPGELRSPHYLHIEVADRVGVLALVAQRLATRRTWTGEPSRASRPRP